VGQPSLIEPNSSTQTGSTIQFCIFANMKLTTILLFLPFFLFTQRVQSQIPFSYKTHGNIANYFTDASDLLQFFECKNGEVIAEIGANDGQNIGGLGLLLDSCSFYIQDINPQAWNEKTWNRIRKKCVKNGMSAKHQFHLVIGTEKASLLPQGGFDKIILVSTFHEFTYMEEMITDLISKLKPAGKIYILESYCYTATHTNYTMNETITLMEKHGMQILKKDETQLNGSTGLYKLVFSK
jgi:hypothetical protein